MFCIKGPAELTITPAMRAREIPDKVIVLIMVDAGPTLHQSAVTTDHRLMTLRWGGGLVTEYWDIVNYIYCHTKLKWLLCFYRGNQKLMLNMIKIT